jgi:type II secretory ATPase GspE/PulE/Tfp pilus assembly ATPase PilB-like protein
LISHGNQTSREFFPFSYVDFRALQRGAGMNSRVPGVGVPYKPVPRKKGMTFEAIFFRQLQSVALRIQEAEDLDQLMLETSQEICSLFNADRLTLYAVADGHIVSKIKTGLNSSRDLKLPISPQSIAGYVAYSKMTLNLADVYDSESLKKIHPSLSFLQEVDSRSGYRTKQMLVAPIIEKGVLYGVLQVINSKSDEPFDNVELDGVNELCKTLATAIRQRIVSAPKKPPPAVEQKPLPVAEPPPTPPPPRDYFPNYDAPLVTDLSNHKELMPPIQIDVVEPPQVSPSARAPISSASDSGHPPLSGAYDSGRAPLSASAELSRTNKTRYDWLVSSGALSQNDLDDAILKARESELSIEDVLVDYKSVTLSQIGESLSKFFNTRYESYSAGYLRMEHLHGALKRDFVEEQGWLPLEDSGKSLVIMCLDPESARGSRIIPQIFPKFSKFFYHVTTQVEFSRTLDQVFAVGEGSINEMLAGMDMGALEDASVVDSVEASASDNEIVKFVNKVIVDAYNMKASDIHIEPMPGNTKTGIRLRIDGSLIPFIEVPAHFRQTVVTRLKIMCDLDISERRKPQDGKIKFKKYGPLDIELRVATIPSTGGLEDVVMRILAAGEPIPMEKLGLTPHNMARVESTVTKPYGLFYVCGPTGSGKTTTLHSILKFLNKTDTKIWTAEDPVEITQKGLRQVQVNKKAGLDFATIMRSFLRADPDIIMVGESRDKETVAMGVEASLTGHLVFSTLHTNSAPESITRLMDMGMDPFNFADALLGILAQRLAKKLCDCKEAYVPAEEEMRLFAAEYSDELRHSKAWKIDYAGESKKMVDGWSKTYGDGGPVKLYRAVGCEKCNKTGYKGRIGLHELLIADDGVKRLIQERARVSELFSAAVEGGMRTLKMDGMEKIMMGLTDLKMVRQVCIK